MRTAGEPPQKRKTDGLDLPPEARRLGDAKVCARAQKTGNTGAIHESTWGTQGSEHLSSTTERADGGRSHRPSEREEAGSEKARIGTPEEEEQEQRGPDKEVRGTTVKPEEIQKMAGLTRNRRGKNPDPPEEKRTLKRELRRV
ncbi:hypothetical protein NDU88_007260 [Pleurodeles waltl]|uniref:Uncharacterized protein n=1 Tax=Pleurodeles waltl TaxID=8319 RepID=A0AAV7RQE1_PLEWA|nr:hypothetical protein NDU88_007260 [Pleurodeles waltl]